MSVDISPNYPLACDIVIEQRKIIVEYDENQHFSQARKITLENYPKNVKVYFNKDYWIKQCNKINAKDNRPVDRDEKRAYYDAVRDIEASKNGYKLIRIKHGDFDWTNENSNEYLKEIVLREQNQVNEVTPIKIVLCVPKSNKDHEQYENEVKKFTIEKKADIVVFPEGYIKCKFDNALSEIKTLSQKMGIDPLTY